MDSAARQQLEGVLEQRVPHLRVGRGCRWGRFWWVCAGATRQSSKIWQGCSWHQSRFYRELLRPRCCMLTLQRKLVNGKHRKPRTTVPYWSLRPLPPMGPAKVVAQPMTVPSFIRFA